MAKTVSAFELPCPAIPDIARRPEIMDLRGDFTDLPLATLTVDG